MKLLIAIVTFVPAALLLTGCGTLEDGKLNAGLDYERHRTENVAMAHQFNTDNINAAIITQSTIYPHHFVKHTPTINELGNRDLDVLADHYINDIMPVSKPVNVVEDVHVFFDYDKFDIRADGADVLADAIAALKANPNTDILITGNADVRGSDEYNLALGEKRSDAVSRFMKANGIDDSRIQIISRGRMNALAPETDEAGMQKDRNAHFIVAEVHQYPVPLNVRRSGASDNLYQARKKSVLNYLADKGVNTELVQLADGFAGGPGMDSQQVFLIITESRASGSEASSSGGATVITTSGN